MRSQFPTRKDRFLADKTECVWGVDRGLGGSALGILVRGWKDAIGATEAGRAAHLFALPQPALSLPWREYHSNTVLFRRGSSRCHCRERELGNLIKELAADKLCELKAFY